MSRTVAARFVSDTLFEGVRRRFVDMWTSGGYSLIESGGTDLVVFGSRNPAVLEREVDSKSRTPKVYLGNENLFLGDKWTALRQYLKDARNCFLLHANRLRGDGSEFRFPLGFPLLYANQMARIAARPPDPPPDPARREFCAFIVSNPNDETGRRRMFDELSKYREVHSYGSVGNNRAIPARMEGLSWSEQVVELYREYKFVICFENSRASNYITEKLLNAKAAGAVPIYRGASNVGDYFNTRAFIDFDDHGSFARVAARVKELDCDDARYDRMQREPFFRRGFFEELEEEKGRFLRSVYRRVSGYRRVEVLRRPVGWLRGF